MHRMRQVLLVVLAGLVAACANDRRAPAPIVDRTHGGPTLQSSPQMQGGGSAVAGAASMPVATSNEVPAGNYQVKRGDTLIAIALQFGLDYKELAAWNQLENPNRIEVGLLLRVIPPSANAGTASAGSQAAPIAVSGVEVRPLDKATSKPSDKASDKVAEKPQDRPADKPVDGAAPSALMWPASGKVIQEFQESSKGIDIAGKLGDPVVAAADGRVVYSGNALRAYGNLVIIKHGGDLLTVYAHNRTVLVSEGQNVKRGQKIADMGASDSDRVRLHFEVRRQGKPIDPLKLMSSDRPS